MSRWCCSLMMGLVLTVPSMAAFGVTPQDAAPSRRLLPLQRLDDQPEPFEPVRKRSEAESDRLHATARYAAARIHVRAQEFALALRDYQRAVRYDTSHPDVIYPILRIARHLDRHSEVARYAVLLMQRDPSDSLNMLRAFVYLAELNELDRAISLYETVVEKGELDKEEPAWLELHKLAGELYLQRKDYAKAAQSLAIVDAALRNPEDFGFDEEVVGLIEGNHGPRLHQLIARAYLKSKRLDDAKRALAKVHELDSDEGLKQFNDAQFHAAAGRKDEARKSIDAYLDAKHSSQGDRPYALLAELLAGDEKRDVLIDRLERAQRNDPTHAALAYALADQYLLAGRLDDARPLWERHIEKSPQGRAIRGLARIYQASQRVEPFLDMAGKLADRFGSVSVLGDPLKAIAADDAFVDKLVAMAQKPSLGQQDKPLPLGQRLAIAQIASLAEKWDIADQFYGEAVGIAGRDRKPGIFEAWGMAALSTEQFARAERVFQRAIDAKVLSDDNPIFYFYLAGALAMQAKNDAALEAARHAAEADSESAEYAERVAWLLARLKRSDKAIEAYRQLIDQFDDQYDSSVVRDALRGARFSLSHLATTQGNFSEAEELLEQVLDEFPEDHGAANDLGYLWADRGIHLNRALKMIETACEAEPDNKAYLDSYGWVLYRLGRYEQALEKLKAASEGKEADGVVLDHLGDAHAALDQRDSAIGVWKRAVTSFRKSKDSEKAAATQQKIDVMQKKMKATQ